MYDQQFHPSHTPTQEDLNLMFPQQTLGHEGSQDIKAKLPINRLDR